MKEIKYWTARLGRGTATMVARPTQCGLSHHREDRYQYAHVCDDCVFVVRVSNKEEFAEQELCVVE